MKTVVISRKRLLRAVLVIAAVIGLLVVVLDVVAGLRGGTAGGDTAEANAPEAVDTSEAVTAAAHALSEVMRFDHSEGREAWAERITPVCTGNGVAFWTGPFFAGQVWPTMMEQEYVTQGIEVLSTRVIGEGPLPGSVIVEVSLRIEYVLGDGDPIREESSNQVVMVHQDGRWLMDAPPKKK